MGFSTPLNRKSEKVDLDVAEAKRKEDEEKSAVARVLTSKPRTLNPTPNLEPGILNIEP